jgi:DNA-binding transcriptional LysR family regulator
MDVVHDPFTTGHAFHPSPSRRPKQIITCNSLSTVVKMIAIGMGISLVLLECARQELDACVVTAVPVQLQLPSRSVVMAYPVGQVEPALDALIDIMRELGAT